jgi:hypothetical protein
MQFGPLMHYFGDLRLHNNDEVDIFVRELLRMEEPDLFCDVIWIVPKWGKCIKCFGAYAKKITLSTLNFAVTS